MSIQIKGTLIDFTSNGTNLYVNMSATAGSLILHSSDSVSTAFLRNISDPLLAQDAATKHYVDTLNIQVSGPITIAGTTSTITSQTGTGTVFVVNTSPTIISPNLISPSIGVATGSTLTLTSSSSATQYTSTVGQGTQPLVVSSSSLVPVLYVARSQLADTSSSLTTTASGSTLTLNSSMNATQYTSTVGQGTQPLVVSSSSLVPVLYVARAQVADSASSIGVSGPITITGTTSSITSQTGQGTVFAVQTGPTLITPFIGSAGGSTLTLTSSASATQYTSTVGSGTQPLVVSSSSLVPTLYVARAQMADTTNSLAAGATGSTLTLNSSASATQYTSTVGQGTQPLVVTSSTLVPVLYVARAQFADSSTTVNIGGPITITGTASSITSQTGQGTIFVVSSGPTLITPFIGAAGGSTLTLTSSSSATQYTSTVGQGTQPLVVSSSSLVPVLYVARSQLADATNSLAINATGSTLTLNSSLAATQYTSTVGPGTQPLVVSSSSLVPMLYVAKSQLADTASSLTTTASGSTLTLNSSMSASQYTSTVGQGTQPLVVSSSSLVPVLYVARAQVADSASSIGVSGPITITGTTSSITSQTGQGTVFAVQTSPTLITPFIGSAGGATLSLTSSSSATQYTSTVGSGTQPLVISSSTLVPTLYVARSQVADTSNSLALGATGSTLTLNSSLAATQYTSTVGQGTQPLVVSSSSLVPVLYVARSQLADTASSLALNATGSTLTLNSSLATTQLTSTVGQGTQPLVVTSSTLVPILYVARAQVADNSSGGTTVGPITIIGSTSSITSQTGLGTIFVIQTSPTLITPFIGSAGGASLSLTSSASATQYTSTISSGTQPLVVSSSTLVPTLYVSRSQVADTSNSLATGASGSTLTLNSSASATQYTSTVGQGTQPLVVSSSTLVPILYVSRAQVADTTTTPFSGTIAGPITIVATTSTITSQTGLGTIFVMQTSPTLITPFIGSASGTTLNLTSTALNTLVSGPITVGATYPTSFTYLIVGGGGAGGGGGSYGGGGGAGGLLTGTSTSTGAGTFSVVVGSGGIGGSTTGATGSTSSVFGITALGGGGGGSAGVGQNGGSGGGGGGGTGNIGGTGSQGFNGGTSATNAGGGGGGSGSAGSNGTTVSSGTGGNGGSGTANTITGSSVFYAAGGGGGSFNGGSGGSGIGGGGVNGTGLPGTANTGSGGGGGTVGGSGGSGIVIISYMGPQVASGGTIISTATSTIHVFTTSDNFIVNPALASNSYVVASQFISTISGTSGEPPFYVSSSTLVPALYVARAQVADSAPSLSGTISGPITIAGSTSSITSQTGQGTIFVIQTGPTLITPFIGAAGGSTLILTSSTSATQYTSTIGIGTQPLVVSSSTLVPILYVNRAQVADTANSLGLGSTGTSLSLSGSLSASTLSAATLSLTSSASATQYTSTIGIGTAPLVVSSSSLVPILYVNRSQVADTANSLGLGSTGTSLSLSGSLTAATLSLTSTASATQYTSTIGNGTQPLVVSSSTLVPILYVARALTADTALSLGATVIGPITIVGTTSSITSQTGTGTVFVMSTAPTLITPFIGSAGGSTLILTSSTSATQHTSTIGIGTAPLVVSSSTLVPILYVNRSQVADTANSLGLGSTGTSLSLSGSLTASTLSLTSTASATQYTSTVGNGTAPLVVSSSTLVPILYVARAQAADSALSLGATVIGPITIVGTTSSITSQTGTGTVFVMQTSPTLITPFIGSAGGSTLILTSSSSATQYTSTIGIGTAPLVVSSSTLVPILYVNRSQVADTANSLGLGSTGTSLTLTGSLTAATLSLTSTASATQYTSTIGIGTAPLVVSSSTLVPILYVNRSQVADTANSLGLGSTGTSLTLSGSLTAATLSLTSTASATQYTSTIGIGTAPLVVSSSSLVPILYVARSTAADSLSTAATGTTLTLTGSLGATTLALSGSAFYTLTTGPVNITANSITASPTSYTYLIIGGGGAGSTSGISSSGGGGAGGYLNGTVAAGGGTFSVVVGSGGQTAGSTGANSSIFGLTAFGGGGGANSSVGTGQSGGSGGGGISAGGSGTAGQGSAGGSGVNSAGGGGGGAGAVGSNGSGTTGGSGGNGLSNSISGSSVTYAGGGGGSGTGTGGTGGSGGGGSGAPSSGTPNTGGGGGGGGFGSFGTGGSGIVIISYSGSQIATGGTVTTVGSNTVHTFNSSGTFVINSALATNGYISASQFVSNITAGTAPFIVSSSTLVPILYVNRSQVADTANSLGLGSTGTSLTLTGSLTAATLSLTSTASATQYTSTIGIGTSPLVVSSSRLVPILYVNRSQVADTANSLGLGSTGTSLSLTGSLSAATLSLTSTASATQYTSTIGIGTAPLVVSSSSLVPILYVNRSQLADTANSLGLGSTGTSLSLSGSLSAATLSLTSTASATQYTSTIGIGTAPLVVSSSTLVPILYVARALTADTALSLGATVIGPITIVGTTSSITSQTGTGTVFVMSTAPTLITPFIGSAGGSTLILTSSTSATQYTSTIGIGTAPLVVSSSALVPILYVNRSQVADTANSLGLGSTGTSLTLTGSLTASTLSLTSTASATQYTSTIGIGTAPLVVSSSSLVPILYVNRSQLADTANSLGLGSTGTSLTLTGSLTAATLSLTSTASATQYTSTIGLGTQPLVVNSSTLVPILYVARAQNADSLSGTVIGPITITGTTSSITSQTGTGTVFVMNTAPTLIIPYLGLAAGTSLGLGAPNTSTNTTVSGSVLNLPAFTYTTSTLNPTNFNVATIGQVSINSVGIASTTTNAASLYITGAPTSSGLMNITNSFALEVAAGSSYFASSSGLGTLSCTWLVVGGGGGGGGGGAAAGGGGGGGYLINNTPTALTGSYQVLVGAGGAGGIVLVNGSMGSPSGIGTIAAIGGGGGGGPSLPGSYGGSGGGGGNNPGAIVAGGSGYSTQGFSGGTSTSSSGAGSGGGGASASGVSVSGGAGIGGNGGAGSTTSISGSSVTYAGGGGGGGTAGGGSAGGAGGGGQGGIFNTSVATAGTANTGGGGGGGVSGTASSTGASGGSGIVIISYTGTVAKAIGGVITISGSNVIHTFTSSGTFSILNNPITSTGSMAIGGTVSIAGPLYLSGTNVPMPNFYTVSIASTSSVAGTYIQTFPLSTPVYVTGYPVAYASNGDYISNPGFYPISCTLLNTTSTTLNFAGDFATQALLMYTNTGSTTVFRANIAIMYNTYGYFGA